MFLYHTTSVSYLEMFLLFVWRLSNGGFYVENAMTFFKINHKMIKIWSNDSKMLQENNKMLIHIVFPVQSQKRDRESNNLQVNNLIQLQRKKDIVIRMLLTCFAWKTSGGSSRQLWLAPHRWSTSWQSTWRHRWE